MVEEVNEKTARYVKTMEEYKQTPDSDGILFTAATGNMIAYERMLETNREDALFKDPYAQYLVGQRGEKVSEMLGFFIS